MITPTISLLILVLASCANQHVFGHDFGGFRNDNDDVTLSTFNEFSRSRHVRSASTPQPAANPTTSLKPFIDDYARLARIVNAISLQALASEGQVKLREIGAELLRLRSEDFSTLLNADVSQIEKVLNEMFDEKNALPPSKITGVDSKKEVFEQLGLSVKSIGNLTEAQKVTADGLIGLLEEQADDFTWHMCLESGEDVGWAEVWSTVEGLKKGSQYLRILKKQQQEEFVTDMESCLQQAKQFVSDRQQNLLEFAPARKLLTASTFIIDFGVYFPILKDSSTIFGDLKSEFIGSKPLRNLLSVVHSSGLQKVCDAHSFTKLHSLDHVPIYTAGFPEGYDDLKLVSGDVNSEWFLKTLAFGNKTNVGIVVAGLRTFQTFTEEMGRLDANWENFVKYQVPEEFYKKWELLEKHSLGESVEKSLDTAAQSFQQCIGKAATPLPQFDFTSFNNWYDSVDKIAKNVEKQIKTIDELLKLNTPELKTFFEKFLEIKLSDAYKTAVSQVKGLTGFAAFDSFGRKLNEIVKLQDANKVIFETLNKTDSSEVSRTFQSVVDALSNTKYLDVLNCFADTNINYTIIGEAMSFGFKAREFLTEKKAKEDVIEYLKALKKLQEEGKSMEAMVRKAFGSKHPILNLPSHSSASKGLGTAYHTLVAMDGALKNEEEIMKITGFDPTVNSLIVGLAEKKTTKVETEDLAVYKEFQNSTKTFGDMFTGLKKFDAAAKTNRFRNNVTEMIALLEQASKIGGFAGKKEVLQKIAATLQGTHPQEALALNGLTKFTLDFTKGHLHSAATTLNSLLSFFHVLFNRAPSRLLQQETFYGEIVGTCCGVILLIILLPLGIYGLTAKGKMKYTQIYLFLSQNREKFEKRWRYSMFLDRLDGKNSLIDATYETNDVNVLHILKTGAYISVHNSCGNTPLHTASKLGMDKIVKVLIENGADRNALNFLNKRAEELIPKNRSGMKAELVAAFEQIDKIYKKYRNKKFRLRVPMLFPSNLYRIIVDMAIPDNEFMNIFKPLVVELPSPNCTHYVWRSAEDGVIVSDDVSCLYWCATGIIMVKESWLTACIKDQKQIDKDYDYLMKSIRFKGTLYENCVLPWSMAKAKGEMPYMMECMVYLHLQDAVLLNTLTVVVTELAGTLLPKPPVKEEFNAGARPYMNTKVGPVFVVHDGNLDVTAYKKDPALFTVLTADEFIGYLLKRDVCKNTAKPVIPIVGRLNEQGTDRVDED